LPKRQKKLGVTAFVLERTCPEKYPKSEKTGFIEGLPGVLGNKGTKGKYRREQGNMTPVLGKAGT